MNNQLAEQSVIGGILINPDKLPAVMELLTSSDFVDYRHSMYFKAAEVLAEKSEPIVTGKQVGYS